MGSTGHIVTKVTGISNTSLFFRVTTHPEWPRAISKHFHCTDCFFILFYNYLGMVPFITILCISVASRHIVSVIFSFSKFQCSLQTGSACAIAEKWTALKDKKVEKNLLSE